MTDEQIQKAEKLFAMLGPTQALCVNPPEGGSVAAQINADDVLKQIRHLDIKHKMEHGSFFLPQEIREKIAAILLGCE